MTLSLAKPSQSSTILQRRDATWQDYVAVRDRADLDVCRTGSQSRRCKSSPNLMEVKGSEAQGRYREVWSEGSVEQRYEPMNKNWIRGVKAGRGSMECQSPYPSRAGNVNPAVVYRQIVGLLREICRWSRAQVGRFPGLRRDGPQGAFRQRQKSAADILGQVTG
jgi:hypothetical protein